MSNDESGLRVLIVHPSPDLYGSDRQLVETVAGLVAEGMVVDVCLPQSGPLVALLEDAGAEIHLRAFPVLRKSLLTPYRLVALALRLPREVLRARHFVAARRPDVVYVNTLTIPGWLLAARAAGRAAVVHVHEAEEGVSRVLRVGLAAPLLLARCVIVNSRTSARVLTDAIPGLRRKIEVVYNGVPQPQGAAVAPGEGKLCFVGRLAERKGVDVALEAVALLRGEGREVHLDIYGSVFPGYEWFEEKLRDRANLPDLGGHVSFHGYVAQTRPALSAAQVALVPSRVEPFGNTAVEALLAGRPLVASKVQGLAEIVRDGETGLLVPPDDPAALARAIGRFLDDPLWAASIAQAGQGDAVERFSPRRYREQVASAVARVALTRRPTAAPRAGVSGVGPRLRIALIGTRGVPARYGGFETAVEEIGARMAAGGHRITVYCRGDGPRPKQYRGMRLVWLPAARHKALETLSHTALSIACAVTSRFDAAIVFNAANAVFLPVLRARRIPTATHVDGLEWRRSKWQGAGRLYYRIAESLAVRWSDALIADAQGIADYYRTEFGADTDLIAYGAPQVARDDSTRLAQVGCRPQSYHLVVSRFEPENHVRAIVAGSVASTARLPLVVVGSSPYSDAYTAAVHAAADERVHFLGGVWDQNLLDELYANALSYLHGHSVGGTNPSLLRAIGAAAPVIAFDVSFNREVLGTAGRYFAEPADVSAAVEAAEADPAAAAARGLLLNEASARYNWDDVATAYTVLTERLALCGPLPRARRRSGRRRGIDVAALVRGNSA